MKAEFLKDDNGNIWFFYATGIQSRPRYKHTPPVVVADVGKTKVNDAEEKDELLVELNEY